MPHEQISFRLSREQRASVHSLAKQSGRSLSAVIRDAIDAYPDSMDRRRRDAAMLVSMNAPVSDWEVMKREIEESRYPDLEGWRPE